MSNYNGQFQDSNANLLLGTPHSYANIEGATASQAYVVGQMIVFNNRLCEVISAIASGDTLTIGTNIAYKNVGDIGKQLVASDGKGFYFDVKDGEYGFYPSASKTASEFVPFGGTPDTLTLITGTKMTSGESRTLAVEVGEIYIVGYSGYQITITSGAEILSSNTTSSCRLYLVKATSTSLVLKQTASTYTAYGTLNVSKLS